MIREHRYVLAVPDCEASARFWIDKLGFESLVVIPGWHFVKRDEVVVMLGSCPDDLPPSQLGCHSYFAYLVVEDIDALYRDLIAQGYPVPPPEDQPWNMREMPVRTPDGHGVTFAQELSG